MTAFLQLVGIIGHPVPIHVMSADKICVDELGNDGMLLQ